jgi:autotransporter passenger strand-loop-strand repeat protein
MPMTVVSAGIVPSRLAVAADDAIEIASGGTVTGSLVCSGGQQIAQSGGVASNATLVAGSLELQGGALASGAVVIGGTALDAEGVLQIDAATMPAATISGFGGLAEIILSSDPVSVAYDATTPVATLAGGQTLSFDAATAPSGLQYDRGTGTITACFAEGTRIATVHGLIAVERLQVGMRPARARGGTAPVVRLGHRRIDCPRHPRPWDVLPVRVLAGAFADSVPVHDLLLSPDHAVLISGAVIPIRCPLNGATVRRQYADKVTYWHVELPRHGVLLADGLPAESFLDTGNGGVFADLASDSSATLLPIPAGSTRDVRFACRKPSPPFPLIAQQQPRAAVIPPRAPPDLPAPRRRAAETRQPPARGAD